MRGEGTTGAKVSERLRKAAGLSDLTTGRRLLGKVDMGSMAVTARLREVEALRVLCLSLASCGTEGGVRSRN